jgi:hypothetical protein
LIRDEALGVDIAPGLHRALAIGPVDGAAGLGAGRVGGDPDALQVVAVVEEGRGGRSVALALDVVVEVLGPLPAGIDLTSEIDGDEVAGRPDVALHHPGVVGAVVVAELGGADEHAG